ncbi:unnamed protein product, partial [Urochloa humidicola]
DHHHPLLVDQNLGQDHLSSTVGAGDPALTHPQLDAQGSTDHVHHQDLATQSMVVIDHIGMIGTSIAGLEDGRATDLVIIIHLVQGETGAEVKVQDIRNPLGMILGHLSNKEKKVQVHRNRGQLGLVQDHHDTIKEANHHQLVIAILAAVGIRDPDLLRESIVTVIRRISEGLRFRMTKENLIETEVTEVTKMTGL